MNNLVYVPLLTLAPTLAAAAEKPDWAFPVTDKVQPARTTTANPGLLPGSGLFLTRAQIGDGYNLPDWYPNAHPTIPQIVARGDKATALRACAFCHLPIGTGRYMYGRVGVVRLTCQIPYKNCRESPDIRVSDPDLE